MVGSLVFLARQINYNARSMRALGFQSMVGELKQNMRGWMQDPELGEIWLRGSADLSQISQADQLRFYWFLWIFILDYQQAVRLHEMDPESYPADAISEHEQWLISALRTPGGAEFWRRENFVRDETRTAIDALLTRDDAPEFGATSFFRPPSETRK